MRSVFICPKTGLRRGSWAPEEDRLLSSYINRFGHRNWRELPKHAGLSRCGKSCRLRWLNYLRPNIKRGNFSKEEDDIIVNYIEKLGNRWSVIAASLPGRTDNEIKNHWHTNLRDRMKRSTKSKDPKGKLAKGKKLLTMGNSVQADSRKFQILESSPIPMIYEKSCELSVPISDWENAMSEDETFRNESEMSSDGSIELDESFWRDLSSLAGNQMQESPFLLDPFLPDYLDLYSYELPYSHDTDCFLKQ